MSGAELLEIPGKVVDTTFEVMVKRFFFANCSPKTHGFSPIDGTKHHSFPGKACKRDLISVRTSPPKGRKELYSNHPFSGANLLLVSGRVSNPDLSSLNLTPNRDLENHKAQPNLRTALEKKSYLALRKSNLIRKELLWAYGLAPLQLELTE